jgi:hypothetical protein
MNAAAAVHNPRRGIERVARREIEEARRRLLAIDEYPELGTGIGYHAVDAIRRLLDCIGTLGEAPDAPDILDCVSDANDDLRWTERLLAEMRERRQGRERSK